MPAKDESLSTGKKAKKELDISKLAKVKNKKVARTFRRKTILEAEHKLHIEWRTLWAYASVLAISTLLLYGTMMFGKMVFNDTVNIQIKSLAPHFSSVIFQLVALAQQQPFSQPWAQATYFFDTESFPGNAAWYHFVNIFLHALSCIYLFLFSFQVLLRLKEDKRTALNPYNGALVIALLFLCHPLAVGAVSYISGRAGLLLGANLFLALNFFLLGFYALETVPIICFYLASLVCLAMALLSGVQAVAFPLLILILAALLKPPKESWKNWKNERWQDFAIFGCVAIAMLATLGTQVPLLLDNGVDCSLLSRADFTIQEAGAIITYFLRYLIAPIGITLDNPNPSGVDTILGIFGLLALATFAASLRLLRKYPLALFGGLLTVAGLLTNFILVQHEIASDQRYYICLAGLALLCGTLLVEKVPFTRKNIQAGGVVLVLLIGLTIWRETDWMAPSRLCEAAIQSGPKTARLIGMLAKARYDENKADPVKTASESLAIDKDCAPALETLGLTAVTNRKYPEAVKSLSKAVDSARKQKTVPEKFSFYLEELADAAMRAEDWKTTREAASEAVKIRPGYAQLHLALGRALLAQKDAAGAFEQLTLGTDLDRNNPEFLEPTADACLLLGSARYVAYGFEKARLAAKVTGSRHAQYTFVRAALELGKLREAKEMLDIALSRRAPNAEAWYLMSWVQKLEHKDESAKKLEKQALALDPKIATECPIVPVDMAALRKEFTTPHPQQAPGNQLGKPGLDLKPGTSSNQTEKPGLSGIESGASPKPAASTTEITKQGEAKTGSASPALPNAKIAPGSPTAATSPDAPGSAATAPVHPTAAAAPLGASTKK